MKRLLWLLISAPLALAQPSDPEALLGKVSSTYELITQYHVDVNASLLESVASWRESLASSGSGRYRYESQTPGFTVVYVSDGHSSWAYRPELRQYTEDAPGTDRSRRAQETASKVETMLLTRFRMLSKVPKEARILRQEDVQVDVMPGNKKGRKVRCLVLDIKPTGGEHWTEQLWIDPDRALVLKSIFVEPARPPFLPSRSVLRVWNRLEIGPPDDSVFHFTPPRGARLVKYVDIPQPINPAVNPP